MDGPERGLPHGSLHFALHAAVVEAAFGIGPHAGHNHELRGKIAGRQRCQLHHVQKIDLKKGLFRARLLQGGAQAAVHVVGNELEAHVLQLVQLCDHLHQLGVDDGHGLAPHHNHLGVALRSQQQRQ